MSDTPRLDNLQHAQQYQFKLPETYSFKSEKGLSRRVVEQISHFKDEPEWDRDLY